MKLDKTRFGPAGYPMDSSKEEAFGYLRKIGLDAMEYQAVRAVPKRKGLFEWVKEQAERHDIVLSLHAPYAINLASEDESKRKASMKRLLDASVAAYNMGAKHVTFHPGYYGSQGRKEALRKTIKAIERIVEELKSMEVRVELGPETTGKPSQVGSLEDVLEMASSLDWVVPTIDFAHLHVRGEERIRGKEDYERIVRKIEDTLGSADGLVVHFTEVEPTKSGVGERVHHELGSGYGPDFAPLAELMVELGLKWVVISESPILERDALKMKRIYEGVARG